MAVRTGYVGTESIGDVMTKANFDKGPGGLVGYVSTISNSSAAASVTTYTTMNPTITAGTSRLYRIVIQVANVVQVGTGASAIAIWDMTGSVALATANLTIGSTAAGTYPGTQLTAIHQPSAGSQQYAFRYSSTATSVQMNSGATSPAYILIFDDGPGF